MAHKRTSQRKLSPAQMVKGSIIRLGLARKVKVRENKGGEGDAPEAKLQFEFIWRRVAILFVCLALLGWISLATGGYFFVKYAREFPEVRFVDIALPHRWDHYRTARGDYYIGQAKERLEAGDNAGVLHLIRVGVQQSPDNTEGRLMLAQIYNMIGRPDLGIELLHARVDEHAEDTDYLGSLISLLFNNHQDAAVERLATRFLGDSKEPTDRNLILAMAAATANFNRGDYDRAEEIVEDFKLLGSRSGALLQARIDWEVGDKDLAIRRLEKILESPGTHNEKVADFLIEYLWSTGQHGKAERAAFVRFMGDPLSYAPRIRLLYIYDKRGHTEKETAEVETYFRLFERDVDAMHALADFAARSRKPELAQRIYDRSREAGGASEGPALFLLDAQVAASLHHEALTFYQAVEKEGLSEWTPLQLNRLQPILAAAHLGVGDKERGDSILGEILARRDTSTADLMSLAERLAAMKHLDRARNVLHHVHLREPLNQEALARLIRLDIERGYNRDMVANIERLLKMRKPPVGLMEEAFTHISSDRFLFEANRGKVLESLESVLLNGSPRDS